MQICTQTKPFFTPPPLLLVTFVLTLDKSSIFLPRQQARVALHCGGDDESISQMMSRACVHKSGEEKEGSQRSEGKLNPNTMTHWRFEAIHTWRDSYNSNNVVCVSSGTPGGRQICPRSSLIRTDRQRLDTNGTCACNDEAFLPLNLPTPSLDFRDYPASRTDFSAGALARLLIPGSPRK